MKIDIPNFAQAKVLVVGDVMLDRYWHGNTTRISPEAPVPVVHINQYEDRAGGASNVALNVAALGGEATLLGLVGNDEAARILQQQLVDARVKTQLLALAQYPTISKLRVVAHNQQLIRLDFEDHFASCDFTRFFISYHEQLAAAKLVILSDYGKGTLTRSRELISAARHMNVPVLVDPKNSDFNNYYGATIITPNQKEFEAVVGTCNSDDELVVKAEALLDQYQFGAILITRGAHGMSLISREHPPLHIPTRAREVYDVTGAGDTVIATLGAAIAAGVGIQDATIFANAAAGVVVRKFGTATVSAAELRRAMQRQQDPWAAILTESELMQQVADARAHGERIIMTNGCFDILHAGHVTYLEQAKALGQRLIVAVNDDDSVRRLKGQARPINALPQRMLLLAALRAVDWVVPFSEDTPERLITQVLPDVLAKGGDYKVEQIAGAKAVLAAGGKVEIIPLVEGFSSTKIAEQAVKNR
jgi:D-beta-D-heptose 7-phosphate kinase / D-beta-D-heptose 1-phosphate adenosyltransferase